MSELPSKQSAAMSSGTSSGSGGSQDRRGCLFALRRTVSCGPFRERQVDIMVASFSRFRIGLMAALGATFLAPILLLHSSLDLSISWPDKFRSLNR